MRRLILLVLLAAFTLGCSTDYKVEVESDTCDCDD